MTRAELKPFVELAGRRLAECDAKGKPALPILAAGWSAQIRECNAYLAAVRAGFAGIRFEREACEEVVTIARLAEPSAVIETALACYVIQGTNPAKFRSDGGFNYQLARCVRRLARGAVPENPKPRTIEALSTMLRRAFGPAGVKLAELEAKEEAKKQDRTNGLLSAFSALEGPQDWPHPAYSALPKPPLRPAPPRSRTPAPPVTSRIIRDGRLMERVESADGRVTETDIGAA